MPQASRTPATQGTKRLSVSLMAPSRQTDFGQKQRERLRTRSSGRNKIPHKQQTPDAIMHRGSVSKLKLMHGHSRGNGLHAIRHGRGAMQSLYGLAVDGEFPAPRAFHPDSERLVASQTKLQIAHHRAGPPLHALDGAQRNASNVPSPQSPAFQIHPIRIQSRPSVKEPLAGKAEPVREDGFPCFPGPATHKTGTGERKGIAHEREGLQRIFGRFRLIKQYMTLADNRSSETSLNVPLVSAVITNS